MKKRNLLILAGVIPAMLLTGCGGGGSEKTADAGQVIVYNWGEYLDPETLTAVLRDAYSLGGGKTDGNLWRIEQNEEQD